MNTPRIQAEQSITVMAGIAAVLDGEASTALMRMSGAPAGTVAAASIEDFRESGRAIARGMLAKGA